MIVSESSAGRACLMMVLPCQWKDGSFFVSKKRSYTQIKRVIVLSYEYMPLKPG